MTVLPASGSRDCKRNPGYEQPRLSRQQSLALTPAAGSNVERCQRVHFGSFHKVGDRLMLALGRVKSLATGAQPTGHAIIHRGYVISVHVCRIGVEVHASDPRLIAEDLAVRRADALADEACRCRARHNRTP